MSGPKGAHVPERLRAGHGRLTGVVFDFDGTMVDTESAVFGSVAHTWATHGLDQVGHGGGRGERHGIGGGHHPGRLGGHRGAGGAVGLDSVHRPSPLPEALRDHWPGAAWW